GSSTAGVRGGGCTNEGVHLCRARLSWISRVLLHGLLPSLLPGAHIRPTVRATGRSPRLQGGIVDQDLEAMTREQLIAEARRLRGGIRAHPGRSGHGLGWDRPALLG